MVGLFVIAAIPRALFAQDPSVISAEERVVVASKMYAAVSIFFAHWVDLPASMNVDSVYRVYVGRAMAAPDRYSFDLASIEVLASLGNLHTGSWDTWLSDRYSQLIGFVAEPVQDRWVVTSSRIATIRTGDVSRLIDGETAETLFQRQRRYIGTRREQSARRLLYFSPFLFPYRLTVQRDNGREVVIDRRNQTLAPELPPSASMRLAGDNIGYLRLPSFASSALQDSALAFLARNHTMSSLVIDVRGNTGGNTPTALTRALMNLSYLWWTESTPTTIALDAGTIPHAQLRWANAGTQPDTSAYQGFIVIVTDGLCGSACDDFVMPFKDNGRAVVVGGTTTGSSGQPFFQPLQGGMSYRVEMKREYFLGGSEFENRGIVPDILLQPTLASIAADLDVVLARALELARRRERTKR